MTVKNDKAMLEKILMAYWISIPSNNPISPDKINITKEMPTYYNVSLIKNSKQYGIALINKKEVDNYLEKVKTLKQHEIDIIKRIEKEVSNE